MWLQIFLSECLLINKVHLSLLEDLLSIRVCLFWVDGIRLHGLSYVQELQKNHNLQQDHSYRTKPIVCVSPKGATAVSDTQIWDPALRFNRNVTIPTFKAGETTQPEPASTLLERKTSLIAGEYSSRHMERLTGDRPRTSQKGLVNGNTYICKFRYILIYFFLLQSRMTVRFFPILSGLVESI